MLTRLADLGIRAPRRVLAIAALFFALAAAYGISAAQHLSSGGFTDPSAPSAKAAAVLQSTFHTGDPNLILEVIAPDGAGSRAARSRGLALVHAVQQSPYASAVTSYWTAPKAEAAQLVSTDGSAALVLARVSGDDSTSPARVADITAPLTGVRDGIEVKAGGQGTVFSQVNDQTRKDLAVAEAIAIPLTVIALIWVFGSVIAALLPLVVGLSSIIGTMAVLRGIAALTDVSIYALNMTTAMGLALAIDYSLFIVSRYREEVRNGAGPDDAVRRTMQTAGRTVLFSAMTVGLSLAALLVFPLFFLRSFAYAGIAVVGLATVAALVLLPAMLTLIGRRVDAWDLRVLVRRLAGRAAPQPKAVEDGFWYRFATAVMKRAVPVVVLVTAFLVTLGLPFLHASFGYPDDRVLPHSASAHQVGDDLRTRFNANAASILVVAPDVSARTAAITHYATALSKVDGVTSVSAATGTYANGGRVAPGSSSMRTADATYLSVHSDADPQSNAAKAVLSGVKQVPRPWPVEIGGQTAVSHDTLAALGRGLPYALVLIALATFVVLFLFTGSVVLPLKALVLNTLSLSATFGAMVWVFQEGHFGSVFRDLTTTGYLVPTMPPLMFCLAFGLSMDYEVFLLSRIREAWLASDRTVEGNTRSVALGLGRTGRIVTAAALLMAIVFAAMAGSQVSFMMLFGTGLTLAVVMDATVVRGILVPAFMRLAGRWNWWAPRPLAALHRRIGLHEAPATPLHSEPVAA